MKPSGRLELTWANKGLRLLAHDDESFTWVDRSDWRINEVRLLRELDVVGDPSDNLLIRGDALNALTALTRLPGYREHYAGKVKLCYIDPPFNTGQAFAQYDDALEHSAWLTFMRDRLEQIRDLLAPDGSVWVHLDDSEGAYCKVVLDELFGRENFVASVIWEKTDSPRMDTKSFSVRHDTILVYRRSEGFTLNRLAATDEGTHYNRVDERGRRYSIKPLRAMGGDPSRQDRPSLYFPLTAPDGSVVYPKQTDGTDGRWRWGRERVERDAHLIEWIRGRSGYTAWFRTYMPEERFRPAETIWRQEEVGSTRTSSYEIKALFGGLAFATPKPERLLQRVLLIASNPGDLVLDCFAGSGTTAAVAHKMSRRWVISELQADTVSTYIRPRLEKVVLGQDPGGITEATGWTGGGGFRHLEVGPSMFEEVDGTLVLAEWASGGELAAAVAAQFGYTFEPQAPFAGRRGRSRLAVIDGVLTPDVARYIAQRLAPGEGLLIVAEAIEAGAAEVATSLVKGAKVRKVPRDLARVGYQLTLPVERSSGQTTP